MNFKNNVVSEDAGALFCLVIIIFFVWWRRRKINFKPGIIQKMLRELCGFVLSGIRVIFQYYIGRVLCDYRYHR